MKALFLCAIGMGVSLYNDIVVKGQIEIHKSGSNPVLGDVMSLSGAFLNALCNVMLEYWLTNHSDIYHYLGFLGLFGTTISFTEAALFGEFQKIKDQI